MANTVLKRGDRAARVNYKDLEEVLLVLLEKQDKHAASRKIMQPWLDHIQERNGYVFFDKALLEDHEAIRDFRKNLALHAQALDDGEPLVSPEYLSKIKGSDHFELYVSHVALAANTLLDFLNKVIEDQDAGISP